MKESVAIIGIACRFPGANGPEEFWYNLQNGVNSIQEIPPERWDIDQFYETDRSKSNKSISKWCGLVDDVYKFDHKFFQISPREAKQMDPQQRLLMEQTELCISDSGVPLSTLQAKKTSVHVGVITGDYREEITNEAYELDSYTGIGNIDSILANRISYTFGLSGESSIENGACASSIMAVHEAKSILQRGESDYALASGINLYLHPWRFYSFSKARMLSPDGQCKTFDKDANGYVPGEGVGVLLLQRLSDALRDGNQIYGIIKGSAINHGGRSISLTAPKIEAQKEVIMSAYQDADLNPEMVTYWEAHGTGTALGDPIEVESATQAVREFTNKTGYCQIGSVKTNIGHLEAAAGMAGIFKVLMMMKNKKIPKTLNIQSLNPMIDFSKTPFVVAEQLSDWKKDDTKVPYRAGVSSFGFGGVNSHLIIEEFTGDRELIKNTGKEKSFLFTFSAKNENSLQNMIDNWEKFIETPTFEEASFEDICKTQLTSREQYAYRTSITVDNKGDIKSFIKEANKNINRVEIKPWAVHIGNLEIDGYEPIQALRPHLDDIRPYVRELGGDKLWKRFRGNKWKPEEKELFSFLMGYMFVSSLKRLGFSPTIVTGEKNGLYLSLLFSEMISLDTAIKVVSGEKLLHEIQLKRPNVNYYDPIAKQLIKPIRFPTEYLQEISEVSVKAEIPEQIFQEAVKKAIDIEKSQYSFKRNLDEWDHALEPYGLRVREMLSSYKLENSERYLLLLIITSSINKLNKKWDLPEFQLFNDPHFEEWMTLIENYVLSFESAVELLVTEKPNYEEIIKNIEAQQHVFKEIDKTPLLGKWNQKLTEIEDIPYWLERCLSTSSAIQLNGNQMVLGNKDNTEQASLVFDLQEGIENDFQAALKSIWFQGVDMDWQSLYPEGTFYKVSLPGYGFDRTLFRLDKMPVEVKTIEAVQDEHVVDNRDSNQVVHHISISQAKSEAGENNLDGQIETYLKEIIAKELEVSVEELDNDVGFDEYGIDSLLINHFNQRIEEDIASLPKTLLFEYQNIQELTQYMVGNHADKFINFFGTGTLTSEFEIENDRDGKVYDHTQPISTSNQSKMRDEDIAIIGVSGRYPNARNLDQLWEVLREGKDMVTEIPKDRWKWQDYYDSVPTNAHQGKANSKWGAFLEDVDQFDPLLFNIAPTEAETMDPQERLFLETSWATLEDAGYTPEQLQANQSSVGVFVGVTTNTYSLWGPELWKENKDTMIIPTSVPWSIANRVSYFFNFNGPSIPVDTACSSSLTAIHLACESIKKGECKSALVGGVNLYLHPSKYVWLSQLRMLSGTGRCHSFGSKGDGFVPGEGVGAVLLKPLSDAIRDGDQIYGVIKGTAVNHGGRTNGYTVPNPNAQAKLIQDAIKMANIHPSTISYVEAHGTGTSLGDPIEVTGLTKAFQSDTDERQYCSLGSIKSNIGHLEAAAGIAGLTKILLQLKHKKIVPSLHAEELNPNITFENTPFYVQQKLEDWKQPVTKDGQKVSRRAGISSFGAGGANAHVIVEEYVSKQKARSDSSHKQHIVVLSAQTTEQLEQYANDMIQYLDTHHLELEKVAFTLQTGRKAMEERLAIIVDSIEELRSKLHYFLDGVIAEGIYRGRAQKSTQKIKKQTDNPLVTFLQGRDINDYSNYLLHSRQLDKLAQLWMLGGTVDWKELYQESGYIPNKISLPTYPFARERYWIPDVPKHVQVSNQNLSLHPLVSENISTLEEYKFKTVISGNEFFIADHFVGERRVLPGVVTIEMVRTAAEMISQQHVVKVRNNVLISPIFVDSSVTLFISLKPNGELLEYELFSNDSKEMKVIHSQGKVELTDRPSNQTDWLDIDAIKARCIREYRSKADSYRHLHDIQLNLRESFQSIEEIYIGEDEAIAPIHLPEHLKDDFSDYILHPAILDGALQVPPAGEMRGKEAMINLPYTFEEVEILHPLTEKCYSICSISLTKNGTKPKVPKFNADITDEQGRILVKVRGFLARPVNPDDFKDKSRETAQWQQSNGSQVLEYAAFKPVWQKENLPKQEWNETKPILLFDDNHSRLWEEWQTTAPVVLVVPGHSFAKLDERKYMINPTNKENYHTLMVELKAVGFVPKHIVYLWGETGVPYEINQITKRLQATVYALLYISQAIVKQKIKGKIQLLHVYPAQELQVEPFLGATKASAKVVHLENPNLCYQNMAIDNSIPMLTAIQNEISNSPVAGEEIRYYQKERWIKRFRKEDMLQHVESNDIWKEDGVYLITGGLGGLGVIFAEYIGKKVPGSKLILTGRSLLKGKQKENLQALLNKGIDAHYVQTDVSNRHEVNHLIQWIKQQFGGINGVIHGAGVIRDAFFIRKQASEMAEVLAPKVYGTLWLDDALRNDPIDFFIVFSSSTSVLGNYGQFDYAYANNFMDLIVAWREERRQEGLRKGKSLTINWPLWRDGGMMVNEQSEEYLYELFGMKAISTNLGLTMFESSLSHENSQFMFIEGDPTVTEKRIGLKERLEVMVGPQIQSQTVQPPQQITANLLEGDTVETMGKKEWKTTEDWIEPLRQDLIKMMSELLKVPTQRIRVEDDLGDYGFDSIKFIDFTNVLNKQFGTDLTPAIFFEYPTIESFAEYLVEDYDEKIAPHYVDSTKKEKITSSSQPLSVMNDKEESVVPNHIKDYGLSNGTRDSQVIKQESTNKVPKQKELVTTNQVMKQHDTMKEPIAIVGMGGVMPQSDNLDEFWKNLINGVDCITEIPSDRWDWREYFGDPLKENNKTNSKWGGFIRDVDKFDAKFFGISPREAELMDPQQRILLETIWKTIEDAGYKASDLAKSKTGLYVGTSTNDYMELLKENEIDIEAYTTTGNFHSILVNRVSYLLNLKGPSFPIDTACSSSLVAVRQAVEGLWNGSCDTALVAGVHLILTPTVYLSFSKAGMLSPDGRCKTFDKSANGYVRAEGAGAVLLKPLSKAVEDNDTIYAVIKGSSVNHGGKVNTLTTPNPNAQAELIMSAFEEGDIDPSTVSYMETHGTGTSLGDPIEINGLKKAFKELAKLKGKEQLVESYCGIGSLKTNIGHLEPAAGISGLLKVLLAMRHKKLPPSIQLSEQNPYIQLNGSPFYIVREPKPWEVLYDQENRPLPRRAGVSSFGFGGVNAHVILEEYQQTERDYQDEKKPQLFVLSAKNRKRLNTYAKQWYDFLEKEKEVEHPSLSSQLSIREEIVKLVSEVTNVSEADLYTDESLGDVGFDVVDMSKLLSYINHKYQLNLANNQFTDSPSIDQLAAVVSEKIDKQSNKKKQSIHRFSLRNIAYTLQVGREEMEERLAFVASSHEEVKERLYEFIHQEGHNQSIFTGNVSEDKRLNTELLLDGREGEQFIKIILEEKKWNKIAQLWISGIKINWNLLHQGYPVRRVSLPTYPFARERYWFKKNEKKQKEKNQLDLELWKERPMEFQQTLNRQEKIIKDHIINGKPYFPGVGYVDLVTRGMEKLGFKEPYKLEQVVWLKPLEVTGSRLVNTKIKSMKNGKYKYTVESSVLGEEPVTHSTGLVMTHPGRSQKETIAIDYSLKERGQYYNQQTVYNTLQDYGLSYGHYFRGIQELWATEQETFARIQLPKQYIGELDSTLFQPTLMDSALQTIAIQIIQQEGQTITSLLPFAVDRIERLRPLKEIEYVYVQAWEEGRYDVYIINASGEIAVRMLDIVVRISRGEKKKTRKLENFFYKPSWIQQSLTKEEKSHVETNSNQKILLVGTCETQGVEKAITSHFHENNVQKIELTHRTNWRTTLEKLNKPDVIYYLGGIHELDEQENPYLVWKENQENSVLGLYQLVRSMSRLGWLEQEMILKVITNDAKVVHPGEQIQPLSGGLFGLIMSIAKEYPNLKVSCMDITLSQSIMAQLPAIFAEPAHPNGEPIAIRNGMRYVLQQQSIALSAVETSVFRKGGVYFIVGGAGGLGITLSKYLAKNNQARLFLIGRSELDDKQKQDLREIEAFGGEVYYHQVDVTDYEGLEKAKSLAMKTFDTIDGVIHAAMVLKDSTIDWMEEDRFRDVLRPKVEGTMVIHDVFRGEKMDFMLFFSSAQSYTGSFGQSNYATACTFQDAYAKFIDQSEEYPVYTLNWGYWGSVGVVATPEYRKRLTEQGFYSIEPSEGLEAMERVLVHQLKQALVINADETVIESMNGGIEKSDRSSESIVRPLESPGYPNLHLQKIEHSVQAFKELELMSQLLMLNLFRQSGIFHRAGEQFEKKDLRQRLSIAKGYFRQFDAMLGLLNKLGFITLNGDVVSSTSKVEYPDIIHQLEHVEAKTEEIMNLYPEVIPHLRLLKECMKHYPEISQGKILPTEVIFPNSSTELVEGIYQGSYYVDYCNQLVAQNVKEYIQERIPHLSPGEKLKILEIGAGTGATSNCVFKEINKFASDVNYVYTDISIGFTQYGKQQYGQMYPFVQFSPLDITGNLEEQGFVENDYDVVIAANILHATKNIRKALATTQKLLKQNGRLLLNEVTELQEFHTLTFGLLNGWWLFEDSEVRLQDSPLLSISKWEGVLREQGFEQFALLSSYYDSNESLPQNVMVAKVGTLREIDTLPKNGQKNMKMFIRRSIVEQLAASLGMKEEEIGIKKEISSYGVDSIMGVELINQINDELGITLKTIAIYDYPTIEKLTEFICGNFSEQISMMKTESKLETIEYDSLLQVELETSREQHVTTIEKVDEQQNPVNSKEEIQAFIKDTILNHLAQSLGTDVKEIHDNKDFSSYGVDSIIGVELINHLNEAFGILLKTIVIFDHPTVKQLTEYIYDQLGDNVLSNMEHQTASTDQLDREAEWMDLLDKLESGELDLEEVNKRIGG